MEQLLTILVVENNRHDQKLIERTLLHHLPGCQVTCVANSATALAELATGVCDVVLLDYQLDEMSGLDILQRVQAMGADVATVFVTGQGDEQVAVAAMQAGAQNYLVKDMGSEYLTLLPTAVLQAHKQRQAQVTRQQAEQALQAKVEELNQLNQVLMAISRATSSELMLQHTVEAIGAFLQVKHTRLFLLSKDKQELILEADYTRTEDGIQLLDPENEVGIRLQVAKTVIMQDAVRSKQKIIVPDAQNDPRLASFHDQMRRRGTYCLLLVPLLVQDEVIGLFVISAMQVGRVFTQQEAQYTQTIANHAASFLTSAWLYEEARQGEARYRSIITGIGEGVVLQISGGEILTCNQAAQDILGLTYDQLVGRSSIDPAWRIVRENGEPLPGAEHPALVTLRTGEPQKNVMMGVHRLDETFVWININTQPIFYEETHPLPDAVVATFSDITDRLIYEQELVAAREAAEAAGRAKTQFLANMSHELRTPMNAVIGMGDLLLSTNLSKQQREFAETIRRSGNSLLHIINDILDFSKIEADMMVLNQEPFILRDYIENAFDLITVAALSKKLEVGYLLPPDLPVMFVGDAPRLQQILVNLLNNAVKFTEQGEVGLEVAAQPMDDADWLALHFKVRDTGIGIDPDVMTGLFESFVQAETSYARQYGGTGLGLAISKRLTEAMGGTMWVESEVGGGSTFHFTVHLEIYPMPPKDLAAPTTELAGKRILIVDDNEMNRQIVQLQAESWQMAAVSVASGADALQILHEKGAGFFDVAAVDLHMPEMDGVVLAARIQEGMETAPPLLLMSSSTRIGEAEQACFTAVLTKPLKMDQLYKTLASIMTPDADFAGDVVARRGDAIAATHPLRILLAEDNAVNQRLALLVLERFGYTADVAIDGTVAIEMAVRNRYDVILMDMQMPRMSGVEATRYLRQTLPKAQQPRIIAVTANVTPESQVEAYQAGVDEYLTKPFLPEQLQRALLASPRLSAAAVVAASPEPQTAVVDLTAIANLKTLLADMFVPMWPELLAEFEENTRSLLAEAHQAILQAEPNELRRAAHTLKSNARSFGANLLADMAVDLEAFAIARSMEEAAALLPRMDANYEQTIVELSRLKPEAFDNG